jgi:hypothetical protein
MKTLRFQWIDQYWTGRACVHFAKPDSKKQSKKFYKIGPSSPRRMSRLAKTPSCWFILSVKLYLHWRSFWQIHLWFCDTIMSPSTCHGQLVPHDTNRNDPIRVASPKVAKASRGWQLYCKITDAFNQNFASANEP